MSEYIVRMPRDMPYELKAELNAWYVNSEPIVRCRDCKHVGHIPDFQPDKRFKPCDYWWCEAEWCEGLEGDNPTVEPDWFCACGERN